MRLPSSITIRRINDFFDRVEDIFPEHSAREPGMSFTDIREGWDCLGIRQGDLVVLALPNGLGILQHFFAVLHAGGVPIPAPAHAPSGRLEELMRATQARAVASVHLPRGISGLEKITTLGHARVGFRQTVGEVPAAPGEVVLLTSGTTGFPSGCVFGLESLLLNAARHADVIGQSADDTVLVNLPLHFSYAFVAQALAAYVCGSRLVISGPPFHAPSYAQAVEEHDVTVSSLTPVGARALLAFGRPPGSSLRVITVGGDVFPASDVQELLALRPGKELYVTYGLTQAGPRVSTLAAHAEPVERHASVGLPLPGTRVRLEEVPGAGDRRQLIVSSQTVMRRRIGLVQGRAGSDLREEGVVATGDVFERDRDGYLFFKGRLGDFIVRGGDKICLADVRRVASGLPHVRSVKTNVVTKQTGGSDYELVLVTDGPGKMDRDAYLALLRCQVCRHEIPGKLTLTKENDGCSEYK